MLFSSLYIDLLDYGVGDNIISASIFLSNDFALNDILSFNHWLEYYFWEDGSEGLESEADLNDRLAKNFSIGLRHIYRDNNPTLDIKFKSQFRLYTRFHF